MLHKSVPSVGCLLAVLAASNLSIGALADSPTDSVKL